MNLQTSFLTPPFGFSLFYLKGVAPPEIRTVDIYRGVMPFILMQVSMLVSILAFPDLYGLR
jgi:TRAP-type mannitol/chloroaromatic compound transport system permease large subunit